MKGKVKEFFYHLMAYGGISIEKGVNYVWSDPNAFFPLKAWAHYHYKLYEIIGKDAQDFIYLLGRVYGKNAVKVMVKKFGFKTDDLQDFLSGASQDGFGFCRLTKISNYKKGEKLNGEIHIEFPGISESVIETYGKQPYPYDIYLCGINAGGGEAAFNNFMTCYEKKSVSKGDKKTMLFFGEVDKKETHHSLKLFKKTENELVDLGYSVYAKRKRGFKLITNRDVKLGDGRLYHSNIRGVFFPIHMLVIADYLLLGKYGKKYENLISEVSKIAIEEIIDKKIKYTKISSIVQKILDILKLFGFGEFKLARMTSKGYLITNESGTYPLDYKTLFNVPKHDIEFFSTYFLKHLFEHYTKQKVDVLIRQSRAKGAQNSTFEIVTT